MKSNTCKKIIKHFSAVRIEYSFVPALISFVLFAVTTYKTNPWIIYIASVLFVITIFWLTFHAAVNRKRAKSPGHYAQLIDHETTYLRWLLPFEKGDTLLGRDDERSAINAILKSRNFKFGYITGEAGSGKTSFVRSILLDEIEKLNTTPIYVESINGDLIKAVKEVIRKEKQVSINEDGFYKTLFELNRLEPKSLILIIDQLEEFFIAIDSERKRKAIIRQLAEALYSKDFNLKILVILRKEFVAELHELSPDINQPTDARYALSIKNWDISLARSILQTICKSDGLRFSEELQVEMVDDLASNGYIKPVEFQIVATTLRDYNIYDLTRYTSRKRAQGILAGYIQNLLDPPNLNRSENEKLILRMILARLIDPKHDTKRAIYLKKHELENHVRMSIAETNSKAYAEIGRKFHQMFDQYLTNLINEFIVKVDSDQRVSILNDYIAGSIKMVTANLVTLEERANNLLNKYLLEQDEYPNLTIRRKDYRLINKDASRSVRNMAKSKRLLRRTAIFFASQYIFVFSIITLILYLKLPPRVVYNKNVVVSGKKILWTTSNDGHVIVGQVNDTVFIFNHGHITKQPVKGNGYVKFKLSNHGRFLAILDPVQTTILYNYQAQEYRPIALINESVQYVQRMSEQMMTTVENEYGFIENKNLFYCLTTKGNLYILDLVRGDINPKPTFSSFADSLDNPFMDRHELKLSPSEKFLYGYNSHLVRKKGKNVQQSNFFTINIGGEQPSLNYYASTMYDPKNLQYCFSNNDSLMAYCFADSVYLSRIDGPKVQSFAGMAIFGDSAKKRIGDHYEFTFSPKTNWLFIANSFGSYFGFSIEKQKLFKIIDRDKRGFKNQGHVFKFSLDGEHVAICDDLQELFVFNTSAIQEANIPFEPLAPNYEVMPWGNFKPDIKFNTMQNFAVANTNKGAVFTIAFNNKAYMQKQLTFYKYGKDIKILTSENTNWIYTVCDNLIHFGETSNTLFPVELDTQSNIVEIFTTQDRLKLLILTEDNMCEVERTYEIFGAIPIITYYWPLIDDHKFSTE